MHLTSIDEQNEEEPNESNEQSEPSDASPFLKVTMPDGDVIHHHNGKETEVLERLELEEVMRVRPNIPDLRH